MAAPLVLTEAQQELISSLTQDEIPIKLRCAIDSRLAVNAYRLPCCDQSICETCHATLPSTCPVCEHSPVSAADCKPNKSLRTTIKVFLRTEEKKRETARSKEAQESVPATPIVDVPPTPVDAPVPVEVEPEVAAQEEVAVVEETPLPQDTIASAENGTNSAAGETQSEVNNDDQDVPHATIEEISQDQQPVETDGDGNAVSEDNKNGVVQLKELDSQEDGENGMENAAAGFPGMMGGDMNQMQMFMAMQNGIGPGTFGGFPMMGMPGMGMDPMSMQNMFMNGGFGAGGMGMNGMNMGMGMGGFNGGAGNGFNNWNTQQNSWNVGQDNFNHPNASGMMGHGDYRSNNSGFAQGAPGFNQGNYGRSQYNDFNNNGYGNNNFGHRGRGRGRGGFGRGGFQHQDFSHQQQNFGQNQTLQSEARESVPAEVKPVEGVDEYGRELRPATEPRGSEKPDETNTVVEQNVKKEDDHPRDSVDIRDKSPQGNQEARVDHNDATPMPIQSFVQNNNSYNQHGGYGHNSAYSQPYGHRNGFNAMQPPVVKPDVPINAPTGPKAMREGLPNVGFRRGQFIPQPVQQIVQANGSTNGSVRAESEAVAEKQRSRSPSRERSRERLHERSYDDEKLRDRDRSRSREHRHRRHRHRSESASEDEKETQRRRERRRERRRRREEEEAAREQDDDEQCPEKEEDKQDRAEEVVDRSRSASPSEQKRSSHRSSRREKDKYRDRERDSEKDRDHKSSSRRHRSHRSHRDDRSRSRDEDRDREREKEREHRRRHSRREEVQEEGDESVPITPVEENESTSRKQSIVSTANGLEIRGASSRRRPQEQQSLAAPSIPTGPRSDREKEKARSQHTSSSRHQHSDARSSRDSRHHSTSSKPEAKSTPSAPSAATDPHTLEREARDRERILKEAQRMAFTGGVGRKRSRDDVGDGTTDAKDRKGSRKKGRRGGVVEEDEEGRIARLEAEREAARWS